MFRKISRNFISLWCLIIICLVFQFAFVSSGFAVKQGGILKVAIGYNANRLDPPNTNQPGDMVPGVHIFQPLVFIQYDAKTKTTEPKPVLAERWERSNDGKVWTFYLRKGVKFHDGTPFNAEAVKFSFDRATADNPVALYGKDLKGVIDHTEVTSEYTMKFHLKKPVAIFLDLLGDFNSNISSPTSVKKYGDKVGQYPTGTGPFKFKKLVPGDYLELEANREYWGGRPYLDGIVFRFVPDNNARVNMLQVGEVDVASNIPLQDHKRLIETRNIDIITWPTSNIMRGYIDCAYPPTDDVRVRQAIKYAIDTKAIARDILQGGTAADSVVSPFSFGYYPADPPVYDPEKAKKLLAEAGWIEKSDGGILKKEGKPLTITIYHPERDRYLMSGETTLAMQEYLRKVGFDCTVRFMDFSAWLDLFYRYKHETKGGIFLITWESKGDAWFMLYPKVYSIWYPDKKHFTFYRNEEFNRLVDEAAVSTDNQKRLELYKRAQIIEANDTPLLSLWLMTENVGKRKYVHDVKQNPVQGGEMWFYVRDAWMDK